MQAPPEEQPNPAPPPSGRHIEPVSQATDGQGGASSADDACAGGHESATGTVDDNEEHLPENSQLDAGAASPASEGFRAIPLGDMRLAKVPRFSNGPRTAAETASVERTHRTLSSNPTRRDSTHEVDGSKYPAGVRGRSQHRVRTQNEEDEAHDPHLRRRRQLRERLPGRDQERNRKVQSSRLTGECTETGGSSAGGSAVAGASAIAPNPLVAADVGVRAPAEASTATSIDASVALPHVTVCTDGRSVEESSNHGAVGSNSSIGGNSFVLGSGNRLSLHLSGNSPYGGLPPISAADAPAQEASANARSEAVREIFRRRVRSQPVGGNSNDETNTLERESFRTSGNTRMGKAPGGEGYEDRRDASRGLPRVSEPLSTQRPISRSGVVEGGSGSDSRHARESANPDALRMNIGASMWADTSSGDGARAHARPDPSGGSSEGHANRGGNGRIPLQTNVQQYHADRVDRSALAGGRNARHDGQDDARDEGSRDPLPRRRTTTDVTVRREDDGEDMLQQPEGLTSEDFTCNICWELLARPVTLVCGHTACESCMAKYLRTQAQTQAQLGNIRANRISCPAGCQRMIPLVLPEVTTMVQKLLSRGFPNAYAERLKEAESERALVSHVRRVAVKAAAEARRQRRRQLGAAGLGFAQPAAVAGGGGGREVLGFGNMPPGFMQGLRGQQNAARFRLDVAVPQREMPPLVGRWYRLMGFVLFVSLCASWCHRRSSRVTVVPSEPGVKPDMQPQGVGDATMWESVVMKEAEMLGCSMVDGERNVCWEGDGGDETGPLSEVVQNETDINIAKDDRDGGWLFGMEMNVQEFIAHNGWAALRSFFPANNPWNAALFLYLEDPVVHFASPDDLDSFGHASESRAEDPTHGDSTTASKFAISADEALSSHLQDKGMHDGMSSTTVSIKHPKDSSKSWLTSCVYLVLGPAERLFVGLVQLVWGGASDLEYSWSSTGPARETTSFALRPQGRNVGNSRMTIASADRRRTLMSVDEGEDEVNGDPVPGIHETERLASASDGVEKLSDEFPSQEVLGTTCDNAEVEMFTKNKDQGKGSELDGQIAKMAAQTPAVEEPRRMFLEFYGPIVDVFLAMGFRQRIAEFLTVSSIQLCPLLAAAPLLRFSTRPVTNNGTVADLVSMDFSLDLLIYTIFTLLVATATLWRSEWKHLRRERWQESLWRIARSTATHISREVFFIKIFFPVVEHVLFQYVLQWQTRYLLAWVTISARVFILRILVLLRVVLAAFWLFLPRANVEPLETFWCHLFTYLQLGTRFFKAFFVEVPGDIARRRGLHRRHFARALREARDAHARAAFADADAAALAVNLLAGEAEGGAARRAQVLGARAVRVNRAGGGRGPRAFQLAEVRQPAEHGGQAGHQQVDVDNNEEDGEIIDVGIEGVPAIAPEAPVVPQAPAAERAEGPAFAGAPAGNMPHRVEIPPRVPWDVLQLQPIDVDPDEQREDGEANAVGGDVVGARNPFHFVDVPDAGPGIRDVAPNRHHLGGRARRNVPIGRREGRLLALAGVEEGDRRALRLL